MKKVFLLSLLLSVFFIPTQSRADYFGSVDRCMAGVSAGLLSVASLVFVDAIVKGPQTSPWAGLVLLQMVPPFTVFSVATGAVAAALLNPTEVSSATAAKLGAAVTAGISSCILARRACQKNSDLPPFFAAILGAPAAAIGAGAVYSALDSNWHLKA